MRDYTATSLRGHKELSYFSNNTYPLTVEGGGWTLYQSEVTITGAVI